MYSDVIKNVKEYDIDIADEHGSGSFGKIFSCKSSKNTTE